MKKLIVVTITALALGFGGFSQAAEEMKGSEEHMEMMEIKMIEQMNDKLKEMDAKLDKILKILEEKGMMMEEKGKMMEEKGEMMEKK